MKFLLADSFQSSLEKLSGEEQKAPKLGAFELQINPSNPDLQCHRLDSIKDKNFWSARASGDIPVPAEAAAATQAQRTLSKLTKQDLLSYGVSAESIPDVPCSSCRPAIGWRGVTLASLAGASAVLLLYNYNVRTRTGGVTLVSVSDLRQNLPAFLKRVQAGEELQVTSRGRIIARIAPERDPAEEARQWLLDLRNRVSLGDVVQGIPDVEWSGDADHL